MIRCDVFLEMHQRKREAKRKCQLHLAKQYKCQNFCENPKASWDVILKIIEGFEGHHRTYKLRNFIDKSRKIVTDNHDNANILYYNYHQDCNHEATPMKFHRKYLPTRE